MNPLLQPRETDFTTAGIEKPMRHLGDGTISSFRGILPQLSEGLSVLIEARGETGFWGGDAWITAHVLKAIAAYIVNVRESESIRKLISHSAESLAKWVVQEVQEVESAPDLYPRLDMRLRSMCAVSGFLQSPQEFVASVDMERAEPVMLKLLDAGSEYAEAMGDLTVAAEVLRYLETRPPPADELARLAAPWLRITVRSLLKSNHSRDRMRALIILKAAHGSAVGKVAQAVWGQEAPRMRPALADVPLKEGLRQIRETLPGEPRPSGLEEMCVVVDALRPDTGKLSSLPPDIIRAFLQEFSDELIRFRSLSPQSRKAILPSIAAAVSLLSTSDLAEVSVFPGKDEERIIKAVKAQEGLEQGRRMSLSKIRLWLLQALSYGLALGWAVSVGLLNPDLAWFAGPLGTFLVAILYAAFNVWT